ncbi:hypothetical protein [Pseudomonas putida]|uniref:hypothetical protein n=1 Tax=Pseudomonas putida TaxID=303 RepID=UPI00300ECF8C
MASDDPKVTSAALPAAGTANLLAHYTQYSALEQAYNAEVASHLLQKALERQGVQQSAQDVQAWAAINNAIVTKDVNLGQEVDQATQQADAVVNQILKPAPVHQE